MPCPIPVSATGLPRASDTAAVPGRSRRAARRTARRLLTSICAPGVVCGLLACASATPGGEGAQASRARTTAENTTRNASEEAPAATDTAEDVESAAVAPYYDSFVVLPGADPEVLAQPVTLVDAAAAARAQRATSGPSVATITDENRQARAARGSLTYASAPAPGDTAEPSAEPDAEGVEQATAKPGEQYWRTTVRAARLRWRDAVRRVDEVQTRVAGLRNTFYATDDPAYRDGVVKLEWDAAASDLATARGEVVAAREDLRRRLAAGRRAGALPGWLREGLELEPELPEERGSEPPSVEPVEPRSVEPVEPPTVEESEQP